MKYSPEVLAWEQRGDVGSRCQQTRLGDWRGHVWHFGGPFPWRSRLRLSVTPLTETRVVSHRTEEAAKKSAEKKLRATGPRS